MTVPSPRLLVAVLGLSACCPAAAQPPTTPARAPSEQASQPEPLFTIPEASPLRSRPDIHAKLKRSPHDYFRAVNTEFSREVCKRFESVMVTMPTVNLHGDAHLEQVAVTETGEGLSDFDDSVSGPPVIDLVRFGTSVALTARSHNWDERLAIKRFLDAYAKTLHDGAAPTAPAVLLGLRSGFSSSHAAFLRRADELMSSPVPEHKREESQRSWERYRSLMLQVHPDKSGAFFAVKNKGEPSGVGIGSATTKRVLYRIEGPTESPEDDMILEAKEMRDISSVPCIEGRNGLSLRVIVSAMQFGAAADPYLAVIPRDPSEEISDPPWWVQSWWPNYAEVEVAKTLTSEADLHDIAGFAGGALAHGHASYLPAPYDLQLRTIVGNMLSEHRNRVEESITSLTGSLLRAHAAF